MLQVPCQKSSLFSIVCAQTIKHAHNLPRVRRQLIVLPLQQHHYLSLLSLPVFILIHLLPPARDLYCTFFVFYTTHSFLQVATLELPTENCNTLRNSSCNFSSAFSGQFCSLRPCDKNSGCCAPCSGVPLVRDALIWVKSCYKPCRVRQPLSYSSGMLLPSLSLCLPPPPPPPLPSCGVVQLWCCIISQRSSAAVHVEW